MKATALCLALLTTFASAEETRTIELSNGTAVEIRDGKVSLKSGSGSGGNGSSSVSQSSHTDASGSTITKISTEKNGRRAECTITISPDGKVSFDNGQLAKPSPDAPAEPDGGAWLGVHTVPLPDALRAQLDLPANQGILVEFIAPGGPAAKAGIVENDIILKLDGAAVPSVEDFRKKLQADQPGHEIFLGIMHKGKPDTIAATLGQKPADTPPDKSVNAETARLQNEKNGTQTSSHTIVIGENGKTRVLQADGDDAFDQLLNNPNVPESMKEQIRRSRDGMRAARPPAKGSSSNGGNR